MNRCKCGHPSNFHSSDGCFHSTNKGTFCKCPLDSNGKITKEKRTQIVLDVLFCVFMSMTGMSYLVTGYFIFFGK